MEVYRGKSSLGMGSSQKMRYIYPIYCSRD
jgi:hypothetical protein